MNVVVGDKLDQEVSWRYTKRSILSLVSSIYDPLGWVSPLTVRGKMFLQTLWKEKKDWDEKLNPDQIKVIHEILVDLKRVSDYLSSSYLAMCCTIALICMCSRMRLVKLTEPSRIL